MKVRYYLSTNFFSYLIAILFIGFKLTTWCSSDQHINAPRKKIWVNVFVHGIMSIKPHISWSNFMLFMKDEIEGTLYEKTVEIMREDPFFFKNQAMQQIGLHRINSDLKEGNSSASLAFILDEVGRHYGIEKDNIYYTYGWTGLLSAKSRYRDARALLVALMDEMRRLREQNFDPRLRIYGYSHGGNVGLNLAAVWKNEFPNIDFSIDELVLLGTPIIADTDHLINEKIFKRVFNLYSKHDRIQPMDMFAPNQVFSDRIFRSRKGLTLPDKLVQIQLKVTRCRKEVHSCPRRLKLSKQFNDPRVVYGKRNLLRDMSPGHVELWFFGWTPLNYRSSFPLYPLPTISFAPVILHHARKIAKSISPEHSVVADIRPQHEVILFRQNFEHRIHSTVPYVPKHKLDLLSASILQCEPQRYSDDIYKAHIQDAVRSAQEIMSSRKCEEEEAPAKPSKNLSSITVEHANPATHPKTGLSDNDCSSNCSLMSDEAA